MFFSEKTLPSEGEKDVKSNAKDQGQLDRRHGLFFIIDVARDSYAMCTLWKKVNLRSCLDCNNTQTALSSDMESFRSTANLHRYT